MALRRAATAGAPVYLGGPAGPQGQVGATGPQGQTGATGAAGTNGNTVLTTAGAPASATGANGDYAVDPVAQVIYGPKASGGWPAGVSYKGGTGAAGAAGATGPAGANGSNGTNGTNGTNGAAWYSGSSAPAAGTGTTGDWYINTATGDLYNKGAGGWGSPALNITTAAGALKAANNLSDLGSVATALANLGLTSGQNLANSGYKRLPGGVTIQWGRVAPSGGDQAVAFPTAFSAAPWIITGTAGWSGASTTLYAFETEQTEASATGFNARTRSVTNGGTVGPVGINSAWFAIGPT